MALSLKSDVRLVKIPYFIRQMPSSTTILTPHIAACEELIGYMSPIVSIYSQRIETEEELKNLWEIDKLAYGDCSLEFQPFLEWWTRYPYGSRNLMIEGQIVASIGIYPIAKEQAEAFVCGQIREADLIPVALSECEASGASNWYCSGIVIVPQLQNKGVLKTLLQIGIGSWESTGHIRYPLNLLGLAEYEIGEKLLKKFGFSKLMNRVEMPDNCDLYGVQIQSREGLEAMRQARGF